MIKPKVALKSILWLFVSSIFVADLIKIVLDFSLVSGSVHQKMITMFFRSSFFIFEMIMLGLMIFYLFKYPAMRLRIASLLFFHYGTVIALPLIFMDHTWMAVLYPWPQTLLAFDPKTSGTVFLISIFVGFVLIPALTLKWGPKGFCGYMCPHGAFYSAAYGRLFSPRPGRLRAVRAFFPAFYFFGMTAALLLIILFPDSVDLVRKTQKIVFFLVSQFFYMIIGIPLIGPRSYCTHFCPLGFEIDLIRRLKRRLTPGKDAAPAGESA